MSARPRDRAAVLGSPIAHTLSPTLHRAAYRALGLPWAYDVIECDARGLAALVPRLRGSAYAGLSLTMPLKRAVIPLLDRMAGDAALVDAVNTVVLGPEGAVGHNTDVRGVVDAVSELAVPVAGRPVALLGGGGAARAAVAGLAQLAPGPVTVVVRDVIRARPLVALGERLGVVVHARPWAEAAEVVRGVALVVSTVPAGSTDDLARDSWSRDVALFDVVYAPWPTALGVAAAAAGAPVVGGLPMLVGQAAEAVRLMTGRQAPVEAMRAAGEEALARRRR